MNPWRNISLWMDQLDEPLQARPALQADLQADVAISGCLACVPARKSA